MLHIIASVVFGILDPSVTFVARQASRLVDSRRPNQQRISTEDFLLSRCSYRIDRSTQSTIILPDSRIVSYSQFGSTEPTAKTIFFLHGWPGAGVEATLLDDIAQDLKVRVVGVDRPGVGKSTPDTQRTMLSHAKDVERVAEHLGVDHYGVLGVSGGGPYALACAKAMPADKLKVVSIVCGLGPADIGYRGMFFLNYLGWTISSHYTPRLLKWWFMREPAGRFDLSKAERFKLFRQDFENVKTKLNSRDAQFLGDEDIMKLQIRVGEDARGHAMEYAYQDMNLLASDPGFKVEDIRKDLKVNLWYGKEDGNVPLNHGEVVTKRLRIGDGLDADQRVKLTIKEKDTHISIFFDHRREVLEEMIKEF